MAPLKMASRPRSVCGRFTRTVNHSTHTIIPGNAVVQIMVVPIQFTGGLRYDDEGHLHRNVDARIDFVGEPSDEVDGAWDALIRGKHPLPSTLLGPLLIL